MNDNGYIKEAKKLFSLASKEYEESKITKDEMKARQAAEKGYLCLLKTINALFAAKGIKTKELPRGERGRIFFLISYASKEIIKSYSSLRHDLHIDAFHEGIIIFENLDQRFKDLNGLVLKVERMI